jgi:CRISPR-associated protein Csd2
MSIDKLTNIMNKDILTNRHDILLLFEVTNGNPNGDPDAGNMPRIEPNSNCGLVSDVCLKRKVRNYVAEFGPKRLSPEANGFNLLIRQGAVLNKEITSGIEKATASMANASKEEKQQATMQWMSREFFDVRTFGGVLSTGDDLMKGSAWGQVRGPVQFTFGQSYHPITPVEITVTRCAVTKEEDANKERTMGHKHIVPYGLYYAKAYVSPAFAERTGFTNVDLELFFDALNNLFTHDHSAARGDMIVRGIYDFEHVGTQHGNNAEQNKKEARLGCAHAHILFEGIEVRLKKKKSVDGSETEIETPQSFADYEIINRWDANDPGNKVKDEDGTEQDRSLALPKGVKLHLRHENKMRTISVGS